MYLDYNGDRLPDGALEKRVSRAGGISWSIFWNRVKMTVMTYDKINEVLEQLEDYQLEYKETKEGCYTLAKLGTLGIGYFIRVCKKTSKDKTDVNRIEVCGAFEDDEGDIRLFRVGVSQSYDSDFGALDAWIAFQLKVKETVGKSLNQIFGGLPLEYHKYRTCVPSPINWASARYTTRRGSIAKRCVKADICSAYGTEGSKKLPNCRLSLGKRVAGRVAPTEDLPFAFYLKSGHMAIWGEGDTMMLNQSGYITCDHTISVDDADDETLLLAAAQDTLYDVFTDLYQGRKDNENNKAIMNMTIGMFHRKKMRTQDENLWPIAAVIKFRCNKRIVDTCEWLRAKGQKPILINTDSILWEGEWREEFLEVFSENKALGNFTLEYKECEACLRSSKIYQIHGNDEVITRWSGSHTKKYTSQLDFGQIWDENVYEFLRSLENKNTIKWDKKQRRYINRLGEVYTINDNEGEEVLWHKEN